MNRILGIFLTSLLLSLTGCATYSHNEFSPAKQWPPAASAADKPSVYLKVSGEHQFNGKPSGAGFNQARLAELVQREFQGSQQFGQVSLNQQTSDLYVSVQVTNKERGSMAGAFITGFTFFIIPGKYSNTLTMETVVKDEHGALLGKVVKRETTTTWMQLLLILALPFNESPDNVLTQLARSSIEEAAQKGLIAATK